MPNHLFSGLLPRDRSGDRICVISPDGSSLTYDEVLAKTASYAAAIAAAGVKPGDRVAAQVDKSNEALFLYLGCVEQARCSCRSTWPTRRPSWNISSAMPNRRWSSRRQARRRW